MSTIFKREVTPVEKIIQPFQKFTKTESCGGIVLFIFTIAALVWANSPWSESYHHLWETPVTIGFGSMALSKVLHHWINDGLMAVFFLIVGLEIKREILVGELASMKKAILPIVAAIGGMVVPALIYAVFNHGQPTARGWGIPMATDIAFAVGVLTLLGSRVPSALKVFLLALAIVDDLGAVLVIAFFYTAEIAWGYLVVASVIYAVLMVCNRVCVRHPYVYYFFGLLLWFAFLKSGLHATLAGVLLALVIPTRRRIAHEEFLARSTYCLYQFSVAAEERDCIATNEEQQSAVHALENICEKINSPALRIEHALHPLVTFAIMPVFALANAGVHLGGNIGSAVTSAAGMGIILGLVVGKPIGITLFSWFAIKCGLAAKPDGVSWPQLFAGGCLAGIGFTMSIFVANLAFGPGAMLDIGKIAVMGASIAAGVAGSAILLVAGKRTAEAAESAKADASQLVGAAMPSPES